MFRSSIRARLFLLTAVAGSLALMAVSWCGQSTASGGMSRGLLDKEVARRLESNPSTPFEKIAERTGVSAVSAPAVLEIHVVGADRPVQIACMKVAGGQSVFTAEVVPDEVIVREVPAGAALRVAVTAPSDYPRITRVLVPDPGEHVEVFLDFGHLDRCEVRLVGVAADAATRCRITCRYSDPATTGGNSGFFVSRFGADGALDLCAPPFRVYSFWMSNRYGLIDTATGRIPIEVSGSKSVFVVAPPPGLIAIGARDDRGRALTSFVAYSPLLGSMLADDGILLHRHEELSESPLVVAGESGWQRLENDRCVGIETGVTWVEATRPFLKLRVTVPGPVPSGLQLVLAGPKRRSVPLDWDMMADPRIRRRTTRGGVVKFELLIPGYYSLGWAAAGSTAQVETVSDLWISELGPDEIEEAAPAIETYEMTIVGVNELLRFLRRESLVLEGVKFRVDEEETEILVRRWSPGPPGVLGSGDPRIVRPGVPIDIIRQEARRIDARVSKDISLVSIGLAPALGGRVKVGLAGGVSIAPVEGRHRFIAASGDSIEFEAWEWRDEPGGTTRSFRGFFDVVPTAGKMDCDLALGGRSVSFDIDGAGSGDVLIGVERSERRIFLGRIRSGEASEIWVPYSIAQVIAIDEAGVVQHIGLDRSTQAVRVTID